MSDRLTTAIEALRSMTIPSPSEEERLYRDFQHVRSHAEDEFVAQAKIIRAWLTRYFRRSLPKGFVAYYTGRGYVFDHGARKRQEAEVYPCISIKIAIPSPGAPDASVLRQRGAGVESQHITLRYYPLGGEDLHAWAKKWRDWIITAPTLPAEDS